LSGGFSRSENVEFEVSAVTMLEEVTRVVVTIMAGPQ
jgi:hypothetical protein